MADGAAQRPGIRRSSSSGDDFGGADDVEGSYELSSAAPTATATRPRRGTANQPLPVAVVQRSSPEDTRQSIQLTVKASPNKLRKATSGKIEKATVSSRNIVGGKRASRSSRIVRELDSDDEEEDDEEEEPEAMDLDDDVEEEEEEDENAEGEEDDDLDAEGEEDDEMDDIVPAPRIVVSNNDAARKANNTAKPQDTVEAKEIAMDDDDDDEELSELESEEEEEVEDEDAEGEDEDAEGEDDDEIPVQNDDDEDMDSDEMDNSLIPDPTKLTRRQRAMQIEDSDGSLMALSNEAQKKKHLTAEEHAMRRAEMARRRKNLSEKRNEEEKMDTINRLLKKQPPKRGRKVIEDIGSGNEEDQYVEKANPLYVRYIQNANGTSLGVPEEWIQAPVGRIFAGDVSKPSHRPFGGRMVEEVA